MHTLVEQVLGIWRFTEESDEGDSNAVPDLARWERSCGAATQVLRAHGYDYIGGAVDDCINMFAECNEDCADVGDGAIVMSTRFAQEYKSRVGAKEFALRATTTKGDRIQILWPQDLGLALA